MERLWGKFKINFFPENKNKFKPNVLKPRVLFVLAVILILIKFLNFSWLAYYPSSENFAIVTSSKLVELTNSERVSAGLDPLKINQRLIQAAEKKALDMLNKDYFDHVSPIGTSPWFWFQNAGYKYVTAGENLARDFTDSVYLHDAWMNSSSHKSNILSDNYEEIGIAVVQGLIDGRQTILAVQFFGKTTQKTQEPLIVAKDNTKVKPLAKEIAVNVKGEEIDLLKGSGILKKIVKNQETIKEAIKEPSNLLNGFVSIIENSYFFILAALILVLVLTIFVNIRVQHPKLIFTTMIFIMLIFGILSFNGGEFLNRGIDVISFIL